MKYILTVSEYMNYRKRLNSLCKMTKYIFEVRLFILSNDFLLAPTHVDDEELQTLSGRI